MNRNTISSEELMLRGKRIHFVGIGGVSMSSIAIMAAKKGAIVTGCDINQNEGTRACVEVGIPVVTGHSPSHIENVDMVVYSSALPSGVSELEAARSSGRITVIHRAVMLLNLLKDRESMGVAGSHGKTTTTYILYELFHGAGLDPAVMLGGKVSAWRSTFHIGTGNHFISEVDESDGSLLKLRLNHSIITNIDLDHVDYYHDIAHIRDTFRQYAEKCVSGFVVACGDDPNIRVALAGLGDRVKWYGKAEDNNIRISVIPDTGLGHRFSLTIDGRDAGEFYTPLLGDHNLLNCSGAVGLGAYLGLDLDGMRQVVRRLSGVARRQDAVGERNGVRVIDDYAHHPTEITATIKALSELNPKRLIIVFQPHRYTRTAALYKDLAKSLSPADIVVLTDIYPANEEPLSGVSSAMIARELEADDHRNVQLIPRDDLLVKYLKDTCLPGDLVVTMGAGDVRKLGESFVSRSL